MNINVFSVIVIAEFITAFMLSLIIALNSERRSAKILCTGVLLLLVSMTVSVFEREGPTDAWYNMQTALMNEGYSSDNEAFSALSVFLVFYSSDILNMVAGAALIAGFLYMFKDNLPIEIESYSKQKKEKDYYWK